MVLGEVLGEVLLEQLGCFLLNQLMKFYCESITIRLTADAREVRLEFPKDLG